MGKFHALTRRNRQLGAGQGVKRGLTKNTTVHDCHLFIHNSFFRNILCRARAIPVVLKTEHPHGLQVMTPSTVAGPTGPPVPLKIAQVHVMAPLEATAPHPLTVTLESTMLIPGDGL